jgi:hypothetical protein
MDSRRDALVIVGICLASFLPSEALAAGELNFVCDSPPTCGKVCRLVCETKKLTAICYGCECDEICIPGPSRPGCKHCATCGADADCGECDSSCTGCQGHPPACEFCWRDWFACGCAKPHPVRVLTKYQAEKEISWFHWQVVDAASCGCVADCGQTADQRRCVCKPAPADAELGDVLAVSDEEWAELATILNPDKTGASGQLAHHSGSQPAGRSVVPDAELPKTSIAERFGRFFKR